MKLGTVVNPMLARALKELSSQSVSATTAYKLVKLTEAVTKEVSRYKEVRENLLQKCGEHAEDGSLKTTSDGASYVLKDNETFNKEYAELIELEITDLPKLSLNDLKDCRLSSESMSALMELIVPINLAE